jgi:hypothetical protein
MKYQIIASMARCETNMVSEVRAPQCWRRHRYPGLASRRPAATVTDNSRLSSEDPVDGTAALRVILLIINESQILSDLCAALRLGVTRIDSEPGPPTASFRMPGLAHWWSRPV